MNVNVNHPSAASAPPPIGPESSEADLIPAHKRAAAASIPMSVFHDALKTQLRRLMRPH
jgi:hypothetical protein